MAKSLGPSRNENQFGPSCLHRETAWGATLFLLSLCLICPLRAQKIFRRVHVEAPNTGCLGLSDCASPASSSSKPENASHIAKNVEPISLIHRPHLRSLEKDRKTGRWNSLHRERG